MIRSKSLVMLFSDLLTDPEPVLQSLHHLRHRGNEVILFHILDEAEVHFPFEGVIEFEDVEDARQADARRPRHARRLPASAGRVPGASTASECAKAGHRLRADGHQRQLRQGADGVLAAAAEAVLSPPHSLGLEANLPLAADAIMNPS